MAKQPSKPLSPKPPTNRQADDEFCDCCAEGCDCGDCQECSEAPKMDLPVRPREAAPPKRKK